MRPIPLEKLEAVAAESMPPPPAPATPPPANSASNGANNGTGSGPAGFSLETFITSYLKVRSGPVAWGSGKKWILDFCPFSPTDHTDGCAVVTRGDGGVIGFKCHHNSCVDRHWRDLRELFEPHAQRQQEREQQQQGQAQRKPKLSHAEAIEGAQFSAITDDHYKLSLPAVGMAFEVDRLRHERTELVGELAVHCELPGARTVNGTLSIADMTLSSIRVRQEWSKLLVARADAPEIDFYGLVEDFCQRVVTAYRSGQPPEDLRNIAPETDDSIIVDGMVLPRRHSTIAFGDGGALKSYIGLYVAGTLAQRGTRVALFDWELDGASHRDRLQRLFGDEMPQILYVRCDKPLAQEVDRLARIVRDYQIGYAIFDSIGFACDGPPESAEVAGRYNRAVRQIGIGGLHIAHVSRAENADQKPFGSAFWHNGARSTWFAQLASTDSSSNVLTVGLFNRKSNLGKLCPATAFTVTFTKDRTIFKTSDVAEIPDLAVKLSVKQRMAVLLRNGPMKPEAIADEIAAKLETVKKEARRYKGLFMILTDGQIGMVPKPGSGRQIDPDNLSGQPDRPSLPDRRTKSPP